MTVPMDTAADTANAARRNSRTSVIQDMAAYKDTHEKRAQIARRARNLGFTYKQIARRMGVNEDTVGRWVKSG